MQISNLEFNSEAVRSWVHKAPSPEKNHLNNNTIDFVQTFWNRKKEEMPMLLQQPNHVILSSHETDQPLDFTMSKFKTKNTVASQLKQLSQQQKMLLHSNGYYSRNNNKSFTGGSSPSSSSEEEGVGPPQGSPESPGPLRGDGKICFEQLEKQLLLQNELDIFLYQQIISSLSFPKGYRHISECF